MLAWDDGLRYDPEIAAALADTPVRNGEIARGQWPVTADVMQIAALAHLPPALGVGLELGSATTAHRVSFVAPPFATRARVWVVASGSGDIDIQVASGGSGSLTLSPSTETGKANALLLAGDGELTVTAGDDCRDFEIDIERDGTGLQCHAVAVMWGAFDL